MIEVPRQPQHVHAVDFVMRQSCHGKAAEMDSSAAAIVPPGTTSDKAQVQECGALKIISQAGSSSGLSPSWSAWPYDSSPSSANPQSEYEEYASTRRRGQSCPRNAMEIRRFG